MNQIMSYNKRSLPIAVRLRKAAKYSLKFDLQAEGLEWLNGRLEEKVLPSQVDLSDRAEIENKTYFQFEAFKKPLTKGARFLAYRIRECSEQKSDWDLLVELSAYKLARQWITSQPQELQDFLFSQEIGAKTLVVDLGLRWSEEFLRFCEIYKQTCNQSRNWRSGYQPNVSAIKILATTREYAKLPLWVKVSLVRSNAWIQKERIGNIWRLIPCAKAWKWEPNLPKKIAKRIGEMSVAKRIAARYAWQMIDQSTTNHLPDFRRCDLENQFWLNFNKLASNPFFLLEEVAKEAKEANPDAKNHFYARQAEAILGLPHQFFDGFDPDKLWEYQKYIDKELLLKQVFGISTKAVKKAWDNAGADQIRWAIALAEKGNPDVVRQFLSAECVLPYEEESVTFLQSLGWKKALRMIQTLTYRVRGEDHLVEQFLVKDTGMLYNNIVRQGDKPNLGRVRCWLSTHEELGRQYIKVLPDESVAIPEKWKPVNGLCAVDGSWSIHLPASIGELKLWGEQLHNCVGGYGENINQGRSIVFAVRVHGQIRYCVEINPSRDDYDQFLGDRNSQPDHTIKNNVLFALSQAGLVKY